MMILPEYKYTDEYAQLWSLYQPEAYIGESQR